MKVILGFLIGAAGLWLASAIVPGFTISGTGSLLLAALLLGIANAIVRPILIILTLPLTIVTLGLFLFVVNGMTVGLVAILLKGVVADGLWPSILAAIVVSLVSWVGQSVLGLKRKDR
jgi:putative membrane protein